jgi:hypothetical protein
MKGLEPLTLRAERDDEVGARASLHYGVRQLPERESRRAVAE